MRIHDHGAFAEKSVKGLGELEEIEKCADQSMRMAFNTWQPGIDQVQKNRATEDKSFTYPADLEESGRVR